VFVLIELYIVVLSLFNKIVLQIAFTSSGSQHSICICLQLWMLERIFFVCGADNSIAFCNVSNFLETGMGVSSYNNCSAVDFY